jgi:hypothetical protein
MMDAFCIYWGVLCSWWNCGETDGLLNIMLAVMWNLSWYISMMIIYMMSFIFIRGISDLLDDAMLEWLSIIHRVWFCLHSPGVGSDVLIIYSCNFSLMDNHITQNNR